MSQSETVYFSIDRLDDDHSLFVHAFRSVLSFRMADKIDREMELGTLLLPRYFHSLNLFKFVSENSISSARIHPGKESLKSEGLIIFRD